MAPRHSEDCIGDQTAARESAAKLMVPLAGPVAFSLEVMAKEIDGEHGRFS
jgi:hypothetical protein